MPTYPDWERKVLEDPYENVDYILVHKYFENYEGDTLKFFGRTEEPSRYIQSITGTIDHIKAKNGLKITASSVLMSGTSGIMIEMRIIGKSKNGISQRRSTLGRNV